jgi:hypothetical protein
MVGSVKLIKPLIIIWKEGLDLLKATALSLLARVQRTFSLYHKTLVHIEGGLGSQIFGVISFWERQERYGVGKARCDLSYFTSQNRVNTFRQLCIFRYTILEKCNPPK